MNIEMLPISALLPYVGNPRKNDQAVEQVAKAIREFGFRVPVIIRGEGEVIDGHLRLKAARHIGLEAVPVVRADDMTDAQVKAFRISVNRMAELAEWDLDLLKVELQDLQDLGMAVDLTGLDADLLKQLIPDIQPTAGLTDPDEIPETPENPTSRAGDLWTLGRHRILCGDSTSLADVERLMGGQLAEMVFTDPPYNVDYEGKGKKKLKIQNDKMAGSEFLSFLRACFANMAAVTTPGGGFYVCHADIETISFRQALGDAGWLLKQSLVWVKNQFILGRQDYHWQHEPILYGWKDGAAHRWRGDRKKSTIIDGTNIVGIAADPGGGVSALPERWRRHRCFAGAELRGAFRRDWGARDGLENSETAAQRRASHHEAGGPGRPGPPKQQPQRRHCARSVFRVRLHPDCLRTERSHLLRHGDGPALLRRDHSPLGKLHRPPSHARGGLKPWTA